MKNFIIVLQMLAVLSFATGCGASKKDYDASGSFEAVERIISAEATGKIKSLNIEEGQLLKAGEVIGKIDVTYLSLQEQQVASSIAAISEKKNDASPQIDVLRAQLKTLEGQNATLQQQIVNLDKEIARFQNLVDANAAPRKQLDDLTGQKLVLEKQFKATHAQSDVIAAQITAARKNVNLQNRAVMSEVAPNQKRLELIQKKIQDGTITNDFNGTVTSKLAYDGEFTSVGRPLYKIADLSNITLRAYISGNQLPQIQLNQKVTVKTDDGDGGMNASQGVITWISSKAEFTPKTIQTKDERANLVFAIKVKVPNDGSYKIGMYGEIKFQ